MEIISPGKAGRELTEGINRLMAQLTDAHEGVSVEQIQQIIDSETSHLLVAVDRGSVLGMLTVVLYTIPTGKRAVVEDVVVDHAARRRGIGKALMERAIALARATAADNICLTASPARRQANRLYRKMGFRLRETNAYRLSTPVRNA